MRKKFEELFLCLILSELFLVNCEYFSVVGPKTLRIDEPYKVAVTSHNFEENQTISVAVQGLCFDGEEVRILEDVVVSPGETKIVKFQVRNSRFFESFLNYFFNSF